MQLAKLPLKWLHTSHVQHHLPLSQGQHHFQALASMQFQQLCKASSVQHAGQPLPHLASTCSMLQISSINVMYRYRTQNNSACPLLYQKFFVVRNTPCHKTAADVAAPPAQFKQLGEASSVQQAGLSLSAAQQLLGECRRQLFDTRKERPRPSLDDKVRGRGRHQWFARHGLDVCTLGLKLKG
jgi:hypothetical protein